MLPTIVIANLCPNGPAARCGQLNIGDQVKNIEKILKNTEQLNIGDQVKNIEQLDIGDQARTSKSHKKRSIAHKYITEYKNIEWIEWFQNQYDCLIN